MCLMIAISLAANFRKNSLTFTHRPMAVDLQLISMDKKNYFHDFMISANLKVLGEVLEQNLSITNFLTLRQYFLWSIYRFILQTILALFLTLSSLALAN